MKNVPGFHEFRELCHTFASMNDSVVMLESGTAIFYSDDSVMRAKCNLDFDLDFTVRVADLYELIKFLDLSDTGRLVVETVRGDRGAQTYKIVAKSRTGFLECPMIEDGPVFPAYDATKASNLHDQLAITVLCQVFGPLMDSWHRSKESTEQDRGNLMFINDRIACYSAATMMAFQFDKEDKIAGSKINISVNAAIWRFHKLLKDGFKFVIEKRGMFVIANNLELCFPGRGDSEEIDKLVNGMLTPFSQPSAVVKFSRLTQAVNVLKKRKILTFQISQGSLGLQAPGGRLDLEAEILHHKDMEVSIPTSRVADVIKAVTKLYGSKEELELEVVLGDKPAGILFSVNKFYCVIARAQA